MTQSIGLAACLLENSVYYITSGELLEDLTAALADQTIHNRVRFYARFSLLIVDEFGFDRVERSLSPQATSLWYKIIDARSQRGSTALITNIDFEEWAKYRLFRKQRVVVLKVWTCCSLMELRKNPQREPTCPPAYCITPSDSVATSM
jgi:DNA replication protein DnaC